MARCTWCLRSLYCRRIRSLFPVSILCVWKERQRLLRYFGSHVLVLAGRRYQWRAAYVRGRIPPPTVGARQWLRPDTERAAYISRRVPPLARVACQWLWPDTERSADLARRVPPLTVRAVGRARRRRRDRHGCQQRQRHHDDGNKMANERPHCGPPLVAMNHRTEPGHTGQDRCARSSLRSGRRNCRRSQCMGSSALPARATLLPCRMSAEASSGPHGYREFCDDGDRTPD